MLVVVVVLSGLGVLSGVPEEEEAIHSSSRGFPEIVVSSFMKITQFATKAQNSTSRPKTNHPHLTIPIHLQRRGRTGGVQAICFTQPASNALNSQLMTLSDPRLLTATSSFTRPPLLLRKLCCYWNHRFPSCVLCRVSSDLEDIRFPAHWARELMN